MQALRQLGKLLLATSMSAAVTAEEAEGVRQRLDKVLRAYQGTHNFHNFTAGMAPGNPAAKRYILSCGCPRILQLEVMSCFAAGRPALLQHMSTCSVAQTPASAPVSKVEIC